MTRRAALLLLLLAACQGEAPPSAPAPVTQHAESAFGNFHVEWRAAPEPIPLNEPFEVYATITDAEGAPVGGAALAVDASMPQHGHGMNRAPEISRDGDEWVARGMLFHMPGSWMLAFDVTASGVTERAAVEVVLE